MNVLFNYRLEVLIETKNKQVNNFKMICNHCKTLFYSHTCYQQHFDFCEIQACRQCRAWLRRCKCENEKERVHESTDSEMVIVWCLMFEPVSLLSRQRVRCRHHPCISCVHLFCNGTRDVRPHGQQQLHAVLASMKGSLNVWHNTTPTCDFAFDRTHRASPAL